ncbi:MAG TPA: hypothetical protein VMJ93_02755 [Verrucomicrobiae bacterium]|nr:hypothetical protein [Verrucomicrobiae bacterium]
MTETTISGEKAAANAGNKRRGTRLMHAVGVTVTGTDPLGKQFREVTKTTVVSCYGCSFHSKNYAPKNSEVMLEISQGAASRTPRRAAARVVWIQRPQSLREQYQIAVSLNVPGNVWRVESPPEDWFPHPDDAALAEMRAAAEQKQAEPESREEAIRAGAEPGIHAEVELEIPVRTDLPGEFLREGERIATGPVTPEEIIYVRQQLEDRVEEAIRTMVRSMVDRAAEEAVRELARETSERALAAIDDVRKTSAALAEDLDAKIRRVLDEALHQPWSNAEKPARKKRLKQNKPKP